MTHPIYHGRYAPSPTGRLHFGSLVAAVGSYLDAKAHHGSWQLRIDDLDRPRILAGAASDILKTLDAFGLHWDGPVVYQSTRDDAYRAALAQLQAQHFIYPCTCSRREIADSATTGRDGLIYPGTCRDKPHHQHHHTCNTHSAALRLRTGHAHIQFEDGLFGPQHCQLEHEYGDFIVQRADGMYAYQLAVVVDDHAQGITDIVRGADLLDSTPRQCYLQHCLGYPQARYMHLPVAVNSQGEKLSKQTLAIAVSARQPVTLLNTALTFLGQSAIETNDVDDLTNFWPQAIHQWQRTRIPKVRTQSAPALV
jgi:glutamyl-Q tRNA(Asp) synthetase